MRGRVPDGPDPMRRHLCQYGDEQAELRYLRPSVRSHANMHGRRVHVLRHQRQRDADLLRDLVRRSSDQQSGLRIVRQRLPGRHELRERDVHVPDGHVALQRSVRQPQHEQHQLRHVRERLHGAP